MCVGLETNLYLDPGGLKMQTAGVKTHSTPVWLNPACLFFVLFFFFFRNSKCGLHKLRHCVNLGEVKNNPHVQM